MVNVNFNGRLGADAELKTSKNSKQFISMRVATDEFRNGERGTTWLNVSYYGDRAVKMCEYLKKGNAVSVLGSETVGTYQSKNGETMISRDVLADRVDFLGLSKSSETQTSEASTDAVKPEYKTDSAEMATVTAATSDDDLPF